VKALLIEEVITAAKSEKEKHPQEVIISSDSRSESSSDDEDCGFSFGPQKKKRKTQQEEQQIAVPQEDKMLSLVTHEVTSYLCEVESRNVKSELLWWKENHIRFPNVARVARKWLGVVATSTPSERVFSICGVADTAKRSRMTGESIEKQVFLHNNYFKVT